MKFWRPFILIELLTAGGLGLLSAQAAVSFDPCAHFLLPPSPLDAAIEQQQIEQQLQDQVQLLEKVAKQGQAKNNYPVPPINGHAWRPLGLEKLGPAEQQSILSLLQQRDYYLAEAAQKILDREACQTVARKIKKMAKAADAHTLALSGQDVMQALKKLTVRGRYALVSVLTPTEYAIITLYLDQGWQKTWAAHYAALMKQTLAPRLYQGPYGPQYLWEIDFTFASDRQLYDLKADPKATSFWRPEDLKALNSFLNTLHLQSSCFNEKISYVIGSINDHDNGLEWLAPQQLNLRQHLTSAIFVAPSFLTYYTQREISLVSTFHYFKKNPANFVPSKNAIFWTADDKDGITYFDYARWNAHQRATDYLQGQGFAILSKQFYDQHLSIFSESDAVAVGKKVLAETLTALKNKKAVLKILPASSADEASYPFVFVEITNPGGSGCVVALSEQEYRPQQKSSRALGIALNKYLQKMQQEITGEN